MAGLRWGIIGATTIAKEWVIGAIREAGDEVVAVMSSDPARGETYAREQGIGKATTSLDELLGSEIDAVYIATTNEHHKPQTLAAAKAGKHVLCEKPLALNLADAKEMVAACRTAGVVMATNHHLRNAGTHRAMRQAIKDGRIGRPLFARVFMPSSCPRTCRAGASPTRRRAAASCSTSPFTMPTRCASCLTTSRTASRPCCSPPAWRRKGLADGIMGVARFRSGLLAQWHDAFTTKYATTGFEVHGVDGSLIATNCMTQQAKGDVLLRTASGEEHLPIEHANLYLRNVRAFGAAVRGEGQPSASGDDGIRSLALALAALEAAETGREVKVEV